MPNVEQNTTNFPIKVGPIAMSEKNAKKSEVWAEGTDSQVEALGGTHSAKGWATSAEGYASDPNIVACGTNIASITTVANDLTNINKVAGITSDVSTVAGIKDDVSAVATNATDISTCADNLTDISAAPTSATNAAASALSASGSATNAQKWAEGTDSDVAPIGGTHSAKGWAQQAQSIVAGLGTVLTYKGSVANYAALPISGNNTGDVYNVLDTGDNYAWDGTAWDKLSGTVDLSSYRTAAAQDLIDATKQDALVSGTNIKTVNSTSLLGSGDITIDSLPSQTGKAGKFLTTDGSEASWAEVQGGAANAWTQDNLKAGTGIQFSNDSGDTAPYAGDSCVALWHFDGNVLDELNNVSFAPDVTPSYSDSPLYAKFDRSFAIPSNGTNISENEWIPIGPTFTFDFWLYGSIRFYTKTVDGASGYGPAFQIGASYISIYKNPAQSASSTTYNFTKSFSGLTHIAMCIDSSQVLYVYANGENILTQSLTSLNLVLSNLKFSNTYNNSGYIDELRMCNTCVWGAEYVSTGFDVPQKPYVLTTPSVTTETYIKNELAGSAYTADNLVAGTNIAIERAGGLVYTGAPNAYVFIPASKLSAIATANTWKLNCHIGATDLYSSYATLVTGVPFGIYIGEGNKPFRCWLSSNNTSWNIASNVSLTGFTHLYNWYFEFEFTGTAYICKFKKNLADAYTTITVASSTYKMSFPGGLAFLNNPNGNLSTYYYGGKFYMNDLQIEADGVNIFDGSTAVKGTDYTVVGQMVEEQESSADNKYILSSTSASTQLKSATGYDATKTQVLKNVQGVLTWVDEA